MNYTEYGKALAKAESRFTTKSTGATAHMKACHFDTGLVVLLTGTNVNGRKFRKTASSVFGAHMQAEAAWGIQRAWHLKADGTRKLIFTR